MVKNGELSTGDKAATVFAAFCIHFLTHGIVYSFGVLFIGLDSLFKGSKSEIAWIGSIATAMIFLGGPVTGYLTSRFGCRYVGLSGAVVGFLGYGVSIFVSNLYVLYITMGFVAGSGFGLLFLPAIISVTQAFSKYRTLATGASLCGAGIGAFVFSPLQKILLDTYAWQGTLLINAGIILNCAPFALLLRGTNSRRTSKRNKPGTGAKDANDLKDVESKLLDTTEEKYDIQQKAECTKVEKLANQNMCQDSETCVTNNYVISRQERNCLLKSTDTYFQKSVYDKIGCDKESEVVIENNETLPARKVTFLDSLKIVKEPLFLLFVSSQFLYLFGCYLPFIYIPDRARSLGIDEGNGVWIVSTIGISSIISRIFLGYAVDMLPIDSELCGPFMSSIDERNGVWIVSTIGISSIISRFFLGYAVDMLPLDRSKFISCTILTGGIATAIVPVLTSLWSLIVYAAVFGISLGVTISLISVVLVDLLGIARINETYGMNNMFSGIAVMLGPPFAGFLYDMTGDYDATFIMAGVTQTVAGAMMLLTPLFRKR